MGWPSVLGDVVQLLDLSDHLPGRSRVQQLLSLPGHHHVSDLQEQLICRDKRSTLRQSPRRPVSLTYEEKSARHGVILLLLCQHGLLPQLGVLVRLEVQPNLIIIIKQVIAILGYFVKYMQPITS